MAKSTDFGNFCEDISVPPVGGHAQIFAVPGTLVVVLVVHRPGTTSTLTTLLRTSDSCCPNRRPHHPKPTSESGTDQGHWERPRQLHRLAGRQAEDVPSWQDIISRIHKPLLGWPDLRYYFGADEQERILGLHSNGHLGEDLCYLQSWITGLPRIDGWN